MHTIHWPDDLETFPTRPNAQSHQSGGRDGKWVYLGGKEPNTATDELNDPRHPSAPLATTKFSGSRQHLPADCVDAIFSADWTC